jgi:hypothetical protein
MWIEKRPTCHKTPQALLIIPCEVQIGVAHMCISNLQQNSKRE